MKYLGVPNSLRTVADAVNFPHFVSDLLASVFDANLDIQTMNQTSVRLSSVGFIPLGQQTGPYQAGDVALAGSRVGIYDGRAWLGLAQPGGLRPPYRVYRRR